MPFGPTNAPTFYTAMMKTFKDKWDNLFVVTVMGLATFEDRPILLSADKDILMAVRD